MKYLQINLENFGGFDVGFTLSKIEKECRTQEAIQLQVEDLTEFAKRLTESKTIVQKNILFFSSEDFCEGPRWDEFREALVDTICKSQAMIQANRSLVVE